MDFQFYDCTVLKLEWNNDKKNLLLDCKYLNREKVVVIFKNVTNTQYLEVLPNHIIEYVKYTDNNHLGIPCYEIKLKDLYEVAKIWAENIIRIQV